MRAMARGQIRGKSQLNLSRMWSKLWAGKDRGLPKVVSMYSVFNWIDEKPHRFAAVLGLQTALVIAALVAAMLRV